jgi:hypothetical protein
MPNVSSCASLEHRIRSVTQSRLMVFNCSMTGTRFMKPLTLSSVTHASEGVNLENTHVRWNKVRSNSVPAI